MCQDEVVRVNVWMHQVFVPSPVLLSVVVDVSELGFRGWGV